MTDTPETPYTLDRRNFLRKAALAGAVGVVTPQIIGSVASPAAACSGSVITATTLIGSATTWTSTTDGVANTSPAFTPQLNSTLIFVIHVDWSGTNAPTAVSVTGTNFGTATLVRSHEYFTSGTEHEIVYIFRATATSATSGTALVQFTGVGTVRNFEGQVIQLSNPTVSTTPVIVQSSSISSGSGTSASVALATTRTTSAELVVFADRVPGNNGTALGWSLPTATGVTFTELADNYSNESGSGDRDLTLATSFSNTATTNTVSSTLTTPNQTPSQWGAVALELNC